MRNARALLCVDEGMSSAPHYDYDIHLYAAYCFKTSLMFTFHPVFCGLDAMLSVVCRLITEHRNALSSRVPLLCSMMLQYCLCSALGCTVVLVAIYNMAMDDPF